MVVPASKLSGSPDLASSADWLKVNPKGRVPALLGVAGSSGGATDLLTEVSAILFYLGRSYPHLRLLPDGAAEQARCIEWCNLSCDQPSRRRARADQPGAALHRRRGATSGDAKKGLASSRGACLRRNRCWPMAGHGCCRAALGRGSLCLSAVHGGRAGRPRHGGPPPPLGAACGEDAGRPLCRACHRARVKLALAEARQGRFHGRQLIEPPPLGVS